MTSRVSVLIPCYNAAQHVAETLDSVLAQTWPNIEIIVVDDGSTDASVEVVRSYASRGVELITGANRGAAAARNRALEAATGDYIQFLDADDILDPDKISLQMARIDGQSTEIATAEWGRFWRCADDTEFRPETNWRDLAPTAWLIESRRTGAGMLFPALWLLPRAVAEAAGPWNTSLSLNDDGEYFTRVVLAASRILFCPGARCRYRSGVPGSLSASDNWRSGFNALDLCEKHLLARDDSDLARRGLSLSWQILAYDSYPSDPSVSAAALARGRSLHPIRVGPDGGPGFKLISRLLGWRAARRFQSKARPS